MKRSKKIAIMLITALVMTASMVVVAFAEILYLPQYSNTTGRYTQVYEMYTDHNWSYTVDIDNKYGYGDKLVEEYTLKKTYNDRDGLVQCTSNNYTVFPSYYRISRYINDEIYLLSGEVTLTGIGTKVIDMTVMDYSDCFLCLGIRNDPRYTSGTTNKGSWSPDTY